MKLLNDERGQINFTFLSTNIFIFIMLAVFMTITVPLIMQGQTYLSTATSDLSLSQAQDVFTSNGYTAYADPSGDFYVTGGDIIGGEDLSITGNVTIGGDVGITGNLTAATGRSAAYVVASALEPAHVRNQADFDGGVLGNSAAIQAAFDVVKAKEKVVFVGDFTLTSGVTLAVERVTVEGGRLAGNGSFTTLTIDADECKVIDVDFYHSANGGGSALSLEGERILVSDCQFFYIGFHGVKVYYGNCIIDNCYFYKGRHSGSAIRTYSPEVHDTTISNCIIQSEWDNAIYSQDSEECIITATEFSATEQDAVIITGDKAGIVNCRGENIDGIGIKISGDNCRIIGNILEATTGENIQVSGDNNIISLNTLLDGTLVNTGTANKITSNSGYVTENSGTATILNGTTSIVVAHGLSLTPTIGKFSINPDIPTNAPLNFKVTDNATATHVWFQVSADPGGDCVIKWSYAN